MKRNRSLSACPTAQESVAGGVYFIFQLVLLPSILRWVNAQLSQPLTGTELNFTYYLINFLATILIYHVLLSGHHPGACRLLCLQFSDPAADKAAGSRFYQLQ